MKGKIKDISKDIFNQFKKVRELNSPLYGHYKLYSHNGLKYMGKGIYSKSEVVSWRNSRQPIMKYNNGKETIYLSSLHGQLVNNLLQKTKQEGQIKNWIQKCGSVEACLWEVVRLLLRLVEEKGLTEIIGECLRVYNGQLEYCYDSWMTPSYLTVLQNQNELQNYFFSHQDLQTMKRLVQNNVLIPKEDLNPTKTSLYYRIFMLILQLGTSNLNYRNYEYGKYQINRLHILKRLDYFCSQFNSKGLGNLTRKVIEGHQFQMQELWKVFMPELSKNSRISSHNSSKWTRKSIIYPKDKQNKQNVPEHKKLSTSMVSDYSVKSNQDQNFIFLQKSAFKRKKSGLKLRDENVSEQNYNLVSRTMNRSKTEACIVRNSHIITKSQTKNYKIKQNKPFNLRSLLSQSKPIPTNFIKILQYLDLQEHIPLNLYEQKILQILQNVHIKNNWVKEHYQNGSIYLGQMKCNHKKEGKGLYLFNSDDFYFGNWVDSHMQGYGTYIFSSGQIYGGELKKGVKEGHGKCTYEDGRVYEGMWSKNSKIGLGKVKFPNEVTFIGVFDPKCTQTEGIFLGPLSNNQQPLWQNKGILQQYHWQKNSVVDNKSKSKFDFDRKSKLKNCTSELYSEQRFQDGSSYSGQMMDGLRQGFGIWQSQTQRYEGQWHLDLRQGKGTLQIQNSFSFSGLWKDNLLIEYHFDEQNCPI